MNSNILYLWSFFTTFLLVVLASGEASIKSDYFHITHLVVLANQNPVTLFCGLEQNDSTVYWSVLSVRSNQSERIFYKGFMTSQKLDKFYVDVNEGRNILMVQQIGMKDAGTYECIYRYNFTGKIYKQHKFITELTVLASNPVCSMIPNSFQYEESDFVRIKCSMVYRGNWKPRMEWKNNNDNSTVPGHTTRVEKNGYVGLASNITASINVCRHGTFTCKLFFIQNISLNDSFVTKQTTSPENPGYSYKWSSTIVNFSDYSLKQTTTKQSTTVSSKDTIPKSFFIFVVLLNVTILCFISPIVVHYYKRKEMSATNKP